MFFSPQVIVPKLNRYFIYKKKTSRVCPEPSCRCFFPASLALNDWETPGQDASSLQVFYRYTFCTLRGEKQLWQSVATDQARYRNPHSVKIKNICFVDLWSWRKPLAKLKMTTEGAWHCHVRQAASWGGGVANVVQENAKLLVSFKKNLICVDLTTS